MTKQFDEDKVTAGKKKQFDRLSASSYDFQQAAFCASFLLKKGWHCNPWERRGSIYAHQTALVTSLVVSYSRPFAESKGGWPYFPLKVVKFSDKERKMHGRLLELRNEIFAHSDSQHFSFRPWHESGFRTTIEHVPFAVFSVEEARLIESMIAKLIKATSVKINELHGALA